MSPIRALSAIALTAAALLPALPLVAAQAPREPVTGRDLKAIRYVENAHGQLEEFTDRLLARLERGLGPRDPEPIVDGRAELQTAKIRVTYAGYLESNDALAALFRDLAAAHAERRALIEAALTSGAGAEIARDSAYRAVDSRVDDLADRIRRWRTTR